MSIRFRSGYKTHNVYVTTQILQETPSRTFGEIIHSKKDSRNQFIYFILKINKFTSIKIPIRIAIFISNIPLGFNWH